MASAIGLLALGQHFEAYRSTVAAPRLFDGAPPTPLKTPTVDWADDTAWQPAPERSTSGYRAGDADIESVHIGRTRNGRLFRQSALTPLGRQRQRQPHPAFDPRQRTDSASHRIFHHNISLPVAEGRGPGRLDWTDGVEQADPVPAPQSKAPVPAPAWVRQLRSAGRGSKRRGKRGG